MICLDKELLPAHRMEEKVGGRRVGDPWELAYSGLWEPVVLEVEERVVGMGQWKHLMPACEVGGINAHFADEETESQRGLVT